MSITHPAFNLIREQAISSLNICVQEFEHKITGAQHIHLKSDSEENVFLVALRTVPEDSTGVAHILEHTALCGSEKYPVRDPFFMMTRRSLNTFMNAFTSSDWTAYPFASLNKKDFNNLLDVYLDAVFFSRLDPLDFAQEGHRLEFSDMQNPNSELEFKGVVFNEMKGAMSSVNSQLWQTVSKYLFPTSTYHFNSGGEPDCIPDLSYEQLLEFYKTHYHPSNAIFMTFGNIPVDHLQEKFEQQVLSRFEKLEENIEVHDEKRFHAPIRVQESYANDDDINEKTHVVMAWLLGHSSDLEQLLQAQLLSSVLLDNSASPLMLALESSPLGNAPSPLCGLDDSQKEMSFVCGLAGTQADAADATEELIISTLETIAEQGIALEDIESALHQLELHQREIGGDSYPYGLQLILKALNSANHHGDPVNLLNLDGALLKLRKQIQNPEFIPTLIRSLLLDNQHRVRLCLNPDKKLADRQVLAEKQRLEKIKNTLTEAQKQTIIQQSLALKERQESSDDPGPLPKVGLADVPKNETNVNAQISTSNGIKISHYPTGTNGLIYQQAIFDMPALSHDELKLMSLYSHCVTELGAGKRSYLDMQKWQSAVSGGVNAFSSLRGGIHNPNNMSGYFVYSGKALDRNHEALSELMSSIINEARFDEHSRIHEIVSQIRVNMEQGVTGNGHGLAMSAASAGVSVPAMLNHRYSGLEAIQNIKRLHTSLENKDQLTDLAAQLQQLHTSLSHRERQLLLIGDANLNNPTELTKITTPPSTNDFSLTTFEAHRVQQAWLCNSQVNFCAKAYATVSSGHEDAASLVILSHFLRNGFLHKAIREQGGAYGGGASQDNNAGCFRFYSYRDPRLSDTLNDFDRSLLWLTAEKHASNKLEEAILGAVSALDRSESPAGLAKRCFHAELHGRALEFRQRYREQILSTTFDDLVRVAETYFSSDKASTAVVCGQAKKQEITDLGLTAIEL